MNVKTEAVTETKTSYLGVLLGGVVIAVLALVTNFLCHNSVAIFGKDIAKALEYPLWATLLGLGSNIVLTMTKTKELIKPAIRTELFLKTGLVLMGATVNLTVILSVGSRGIIQALIMITSVFFFTWWLGGKFKLPDSLRAVMSTAISVCGVSAAIAAAGSVLAKKQELAYVTALVIFTALPLMIFMPLLATWLGLPPAVAGAWFGGNIDTTAAVVGAGTIHGETTAQIASVVKMTQNALIGIVAFLLAFYFTTQVEKGRRPSAGIIWQRFPKFVIGFVVMSVLASFNLFAKAHIASIKNLQQWAFNLAFVCIGLELSFVELKQLGRKPTTVFLIATAFNTILALLVAFVVFGIF